MSAAPAMTRAASLRPESPADPHARPIARQLCDVGAICLAVAAGLTALLPAFGAARLAMAGGLGILLGAAIAMAGARWRWGSLLVACGVVLGYALTFGALVAPQEMIAGVVPSLGALRGLALAAVQSWRDLLTLAPPFDARPELAAVPGLLALGGTVTAASLALRLRRPWWALAPVLGVLVAAILLGTSDAALPLARGAALSAAVLGWSAWRWRETWNARSAATHTTMGGRRSTAIAMVALSVLGGTGAAIATVSDAPRLVLRDQIVPPFDLRDYVSPLQSYRGYIRDFEDEVLLSVSGLPSGARIRLASMDGYDGVVYDVTEGGGGASFLSATSVLPQPRTPSEGTEVSLDVTVGAYAGIWVPVIGAPQEVAFAESETRDLEQGLYANPESGVVLTTRGLAAGDTYRVTGVLPAVPSDEELADAAPAALVQAPVQEVPAVVASLASEILTEEGPPAAMMRQLQTSLVTSGYFSHGLEGESPSVSGHGAQRIATFLGGEQMVGDDEQYAVAMALMARQLGFPARVVMGWYLEPGLEGDVELTGGDLRVWTEIAYEGYGWVPYDPTPPEDQVPQDTSTDPRSNPQPQVLQPPPTPEEPAQEPPAAVRENADSDEDEDEEEGNSGWNLWFIVAAALAAGLALLLLPLLVVVLLKQRRARRRSRRGEPVTRVAGGWSEVLDAATDLGVDVPVSSTRRQGATMLAERFQAPTVVVLARNTDAFVFGAGEPSDSDASAQWGEVRDAMRQMRATQSWWSRARARVSLRSLRRRKSPGSKSPGSKTKETR